jgi:hypothetical protein
MDVQIIHPDNTIGISFSDKAKEAIRHKFNPSGLANVNDLKALAAAFITVCDRIAAEKPEAGRELAVAVTNMQTASMWAVLGATKGL